MSALDLLKELFPGRVSVTPIEAGHSALCMAKSSVYNAVCAGTFPVRLTRIGEHKRVVLLTDLAAFLDGQQSDANPRRRPGRPTKAEQVARQQEGGAK